MIRMTIRASSRLAGLGIRSENGVKRLTGAQWFGFHRLFHGFLLSRVACGKESSVYWRSYEDLGCSTGVFVVWREEQN